MELKSGAKLGPYEIIYDVSADGQHFLIPYWPEAKSPEPLTLIQSWAAALKK